MMVQLIADKQRLFGLDGILNNKLKFIFQLTVQQESWEEHPPVFPIIDVKYIFRFNLNKPAEKMFLLKTRRAVITFY